MKNKWLLISSISTLLGLSAGILYIVLVDRTYSLIHQNAAVADFWSVFALWSFLLFFVVALFSNVLVLWEQEILQSLSCIPKKAFTVFSSASIHQHFLHEAEHCLQQRGTLSPVKDGDITLSAEEYWCLQGTNKYLVLFQRQTKPVEMNQLRRFFQYMLAAEYSAGIVISDGSFSDQIIIYAREANIELINTRNLKKYKKILKRREMVIA